MSGNQELALSDLSWLGHLLPKLNDQPKDVETNWLVFTGPPRSGKTTTLHYLQQQGIPVDNEAAAIVLDDSVIADELSFQRTILRAIMASHLSRPKQLLALLDRALPDGIAYYRFKNLPESEVVTLCSYFRYRTVFIFDKIPIDLCPADPLRGESEPDIDRLAHLTRESYELVGYKPITVPVMSVKERAQFVLNHLQGVET